MRNNEPDQYCLVYHKPINSYYLVEGHNPLGRNRTDISGSDFDSINLCLNQAIDPGKRTILRLSEISNEFQSRLEKKYSETRVKIRVLEKSTNSD